MQQRLESLESLDTLYNSAGPDDVDAVLRKKSLDVRDFSVLLSRAATSRLEVMALRAKNETLRHFGLAKHMFAPLYLANYCTNQCVYCGFHAALHIKRQALGAEEIDNEARALAATGLRRVLALTGDAPKRTGAAYIAAGVAILARYFPSVGIEVQALTEDEYALVAASGADSMTMFQETYNKSLYARLHPGGPKRDFSFRLGAPERAARAGMRGITLGVLLGLDRNWRFDMLRLMVHGQWLQRRYPHLELSFSLPRIRPLSSKDNRASAFSAYPITDKEFVQALVALRCCMPHAGITLSTRESAFMRDRLLPLGVTKVSAGVCTGVGGYANAQEKKEAQFVIDDERSVDEMARDIQRLGYQPVFADWLLPADGTLALAKALHRSLGSPAQAPGL